eukprot:2027964-Pyramimonas_sp.AAC.1
MAQRHPPNNSKLRFGRSGRRRLEAGWPETAPRGPQHAPRRPPEGLKEARNKFCEAPRCSPRRSLRKTELRRMGGMRRAR